MAPQTKPPVAHRAVDAFYAVFIGLMIIYPFFFDFAAHYPVEPGHWTKTTYEWMLREFNDPLFVRQEAFLGFYTFFEVLYLLPHGIWCLRLLLKDDYMMPFNVLIWSTYVWHSTAVCTVEIWYAKDWPIEDINKLLPGYIAFLAIDTVIFLDMFFRVRSELLKKQKLA